jgi:hypothetical protein
MEAGEGCNPAVEGNERKYQGYAVVAVDDAVGIQHRNDFKYEMLAQLSRNFFIRH